MGNFGERLKSCIAQQNLYVYRLANETGIDRSLIQNVMSGKKKLNTQDFSRLVSADYFTPEQLTALSNEYCLEIFGKAKMKKFAYIEKAFSGEVKKELRHDLNYIDVDVKANEFYKGRDKVLSVINKLVNSGKVENFYSNFPFSQRDVSAVIYSACKNKNIDNFWHIVSRNDGSDCNNLEIVFNSIHFAEIGYYTYSTEKKSAGSSFFPYYMLIDNYFLQFDEKVKNAVLSDAKPMLNFITENIEELKENIKVVANINNDAFDMLAEFTKFSVSDKHEIYTFSNYVCGATVTPEVVDAIATPAFKSIPGATSAIISYYGLVRKASSKDEDGAYSDSVKTVIITYEGLESFARNGRICEFPEKYADTVPREMRAKMIKNMYANENVKFYVTNPKFFSTDYQFNMDTNNGSFTIAACDDINAEGAFSGQAAYLCDRHILAVDVEDFLKYMVISEKTYSHELSKEVAENFIASL